MRVSIIIPYFQVNPGILVRAVRSVLNQVRIYDRADIESVELIVVDDASPVAADSELDDIDVPGHLACRVYRQANSGPGGARNRGLDIAGDEAIIAFLDSDDEWMPDHLDRAVTAIAAGYDVYGSNWKPLGDLADAMSMPTRRSLALKKADVLVDAGEITGDPLISEMTAPMCKLSGLVYRPSKFPGLRFDARFRNASEDVLFIYAMMLGGPKVMISTRPEVRSGRGVNVYESAERGTAKKLSVIYDQTLATKLASGIVGARPEAREILKQNLHNQRRSFAANTWQMISRFRLPVRQALKHAAVDPLVLINLISYPLRRVLTRKK